MTTDNLVLQQKIMTVMNTSDRYTNTLLLKRLEEDGFALTERILKENLLELLRQNQVRNFGTSWKNAVFLHSSEIEEYKSIFDSLKPIFPNIPENHVQENTQKPENKNPEPDVLNELFVLCPYCNSRLQIEEEFINMKAQCMKCETEFIILSRKIGEKQLSTKML